MGNWFLVRVQAGDLVEYLKEQIQNRLGIPIEFQNLIYMGRSLQDDILLQDYRIKRNSYIIITLWLRGACQVPVTLRVQHRLKVQ